MGETPNKPDDVLASFDTFKDEELEAADRALMYMNVVFDTGDYSVVDDAAYLYHAAECVATYARDKEAVKLMVDHHFEASELLTAFYFRTEQSSMRWRASASERFSTIDWKDVCERAVRIAITRAGDDDDKYEDDLSRMEAGAQLIVQLH